MSRNHQNSPENANNKPKQVLWLDKTRYISGKFKYFSQEESFYLFVSEKKPTFKQSLTA